MARAPKKTTTKKGPTEAPADARQIVMRDVADLTPYDRNPRTISDQAVEVVAKSIKEFGFTNPILISSDDEIVAGHTRLRAAKSLDMTTVPTITLALTAAQVQAYRIADNKTGEFTGWNYDLLRGEIELLKELEFDVDATGFSAEELDKLLNVGGVPSLDDLEKEFGEHDPVDGWPIVKVKLSPDVKAMWDATMCAAGRDGDGDSIKVDRMLHCIDMGALAAYVET